MFREIFFFWGYVGVNPTLYIIVCAKMGSGFLIFFPSFFYYFPFFLFFSLSIFLGGIKHFEMFI